MNIILLIVVCVVGLPLAFLKFSDQFGAALLFLVGTYLAGDSLLTMRVEKALASRGEHAVVQPLGDSYTVVTKVRSGSKSYKARIGFQTKAGQTVAEETDIPESTLDQFKSGQKPTVTYLPDKPKTYRFDPWRPKAGDDVGFSLAIMGAAALWIGFKRLSGSSTAEA